MLSNKQKTILVFLAVATFATFGIVIAVGYVMTSNTTPPIVVDAAPTPTPSPTPSPTPAPTATMALTASTTTLTVGSNLVLTATVSDASPSIQVTFRDQVGDAVGYATTNSVGVATLTFQPPAGTWTYHATATHP
jgi:hypothetical protein